MDPYGGYGFPPQQPPLQAPAAPVAPPVAAVAPPAPLFQAPPPAVAAPFVAPPVPAAAVAPPVAPAPLTPADQGDEWKTEGHPLIGREIITPANSEGRVVGWLSAAESDFCDDKGQPAALFHVQYTAGELEAANEIWSCTKSRRISRYPTMTTPLPQSTRPLPSTAPTPGRTCLRRSSTRRRRRPSKKETTIYDNVGTVLPLPYERPRAKFLPKDCEYDYACPTASSRSPSRNCEYDYA